MRKCLLILGLSLIIAFQGCAFFKNSETGSREEAGYAGMSKGEMQNEINKMEIENKNLRSQLAALANENERIRAEKENEASRILNQNEALIEELKRLKEENQKISNENEDLKKGQRTSSAKDDSVKLKVKVLSGDGILDSAGRMAVKLRQMGYDVKSIDRASKSGYAENIVYYAKDYSGEGKSLASALGGNTVARPMGWSSVFDIIVVTGKNP
ncbi:MAG TPA: hypothetical protein ENN86_00490 [Desulfobacteraceae bacterium]|nr:hypothetical protein [Desulfobacteraceae bacterium]